MNKVSVFTIVPVIVILVGCILYYLSQGIKRNFKAEVQKGLLSNETLEKGIVAEGDIAHLPKLIQRYLMYVGVIGREKVNSLHTKTEINMDLGQSRGWTKMKAEEYNFFDKNPGRMVLMEFKMKGLPVLGMDSYIDGHGNMLMKPLGLMTAVDAKGHEMDDTSAKVMMFLNMCIAAPATLIDDRITWMPISDTSIKATFDDNGCAVSAILDFDESGELVNFSTEDKYYLAPNGDYLKVKWSTPVKNYRYINGLKLSTYGEAIWHFAEGDYCYGKLNLKKISYNGEI